MNGKFCTLRHSKLYEEQAAQIADTRDVDEAVRILLCSISHNPDAFPFVPGFSKIQIARTDSYSRGGTALPPLRLWFRRIDPNIVELLAIEAYEKTASE